MDAMKPIELAGDLVAIKPLQVEHAAGLLDAADAEEAFAYSILRSEWSDAKEGLRNRITAAKGG